MIEQVREGIGIEDFKKLRPDEHYEVVNGELVKKQMTPSYRHIYIIREIFKLLLAFVEQHQSGEVFPDGLSYQLSLVADTIRGSRIPDVSFIRRAHIPPQFDYDSGFPGAPDLAIEVISPSESAEDTLEKIKDYLAAGTEQVWVLYPTLKQVYVYLRDTPDTVRIYHEQDMLEAPTLFAGLQIKVADLFVMQS